MNRRIEGIQKDTGNYFLVFVQSRVSTCLLLHNNMLTNINRLIIDFARYMKIPRIDSNLGYSTHTTIRIKVYKIRVKCLVRSQLFSSAILLADISITTNISLQHCFMLVIFPKKIRCRVSFLIFFMQLLQRTNLLSN